MNAPDTLQGHIAPPTALSPHPPPYRPAHRLATTIPAPHCRCQRLSAVCVLLVSSLSCRAPANGRVRPPRRCVAADGTTVFCQWCALIWYMASYIPYGQKMITKVLGKAIDF